MGIPTLPNEAPIDASVDTSLDPTIAAPPASGIDDGSAQGVDDRAQDWERRGRYFEYSKAANPVGSGHVSRVPVRTFSPALYGDGPSRIVPLDLSQELEIASGPATSPALLASFVRIVAGEDITTAPNATSELYYVLRGRGFTAVDGERIGWEKGDFVVLPAGSHATHQASSDSAFYYVTDEPLLRYLGVTATQKRFRPTKFPRARAVTELAAIAQRPGANEKSRVSVLLANEDQEQTLTITHTLWAMFGLLPAGQIQRPHRHQSVALDLILDCPPGCYTLLGDRLDERGEIVDPVRVSWEPGGAFVTPPGKWHAHHNESGINAHLIPIQDAGLQTYLRTLDIRFSDRQ